jgi:hypothetical protein
VDVAGLETACLSLGGAEASVDPEAAAASAATG